MKKSKSWYNDMLELALSIDFSRVDFVYLFLTLHSVASLMLETQN